MKIIQKIKCWWYGHRWTDPFRSLYTDYQTWHQNCVVCGKSKRTMVFWDEPKRNYQFRATKAGVRICPFFIWTSENIEGLGHQENDVNLTFCNHEENKVDTEGNCQEALCPLIKEQK